MVWQDPKDWTSGELVGEGDMNLEVRDKLLTLKVAVNDDGKIHALSSTYLANLSGANLTGVMKLAASNTFTAGVHDFSAGAGTRLCVPANTNAWAT